MLIEDNGIEVEGCGGHDDTDDGESHGDFKAYDLSGGADTAHERIFTKRGPSAIGESIGIEGTDGKEEEDTGSDISDSEALVIVPGSGAEWDNGEADEWGYEGEDRSEDE